MLIDFFPSYTMVKRWNSEFKMDRTHTKDESRSGCLVEVTTSQTIDKIHKNVLDNGRLKLSELAKTVKISNERANNISSMHKFYAI